MGVLCCYLTPTTSEIFFHTSCPHELVDPESEMTANPKNATQWHPIVDTKSNTISKT